MVAGVSTGVNKTRLSKIGTLWVALRTMYTCIYVVQNKATSAIRSLLFLWSLCLSMNLLREAGRKYESIEAKPTNPVDMA
jgi:uncharacterized MAPEG superfamily protein